MKILKKIAFFILLPTFLFILITSIYENVKIAKKLDEFLENSILDEVKSNSNNKYYYHNDSTYYSSGKYLNPGNFCDVILTTSGAPQAPILHELVSWTIGGHIAICGMKYNDEYFGFSSNTTLETTLDNKNDSAYYINSNSWDDTYFYPNYYIFRIELTLEQSYIIFNEAVSMLGDPYNFMFVTNYKEKSYCSDFVSKSFHKAGINLNYDLGTTTVLDVAASNKTKLIGYKKFENNISYYYTL